VNMESLYDYGSRSGFWRLKRLFQEKNIPATVFAVGMALERNPQVCQALREMKSWEIASHGYRWMDYSQTDEKTERQHITKTVEIHERLLGKRPAGMYQGKVVFIRKWLRVVWTANSFVSRPLAKHQYTPAGGSRRRLQVRFRFLRRRPPLLDTRVRRKASSGNPLHLERE
jgi:peptidoglycan/xylan/chitin deacetylase (PgdA/CDA1 family)